VSQVEPKVVTEDVAIVLERVVRPGDDDGGEAVSLIAERADTSTRTVYRVLSSRPSDDDPIPSINLDLADRLVIAAGGHLSACRLKWPGEEVTPYLSGNVEELGKVLV
jgi:hypothetical protein